MASVASLVRDLQLQVVAVAPAIIAQGVADVQGFFDDGGGDQAYEGINPIQSASSFSAWIEFEGAPFHPSGYRSTGAYGSEL
jgi:hypothetical protein